ncbi:hypothetical protein ACJIZ3_008596 [Penstemon smallii]|uniref:Yippee domain-containing protein n=1 Tax=Penstemon smallii TaxID=265156 RepID=A0ABD3TBF6_9LAMI
MSNIPPAPTNSDPNPTSSNPNPTMPTTNSIPNFDPLTMKAICCRHCTNFIAVFQGNVEFAEAMYCIRCPGDKYMPLSLSLYLHYRLFDDNYMILNNLFNVHMGDTHLNTTKVVHCDKCKNVLGWRQIASGPHFINPTCTMLLSRQGEGNENILSMLKMSLR